ncbi:hypothetical protein [Leptolyngbya sp. 7M]|uniref:hypothetical protein n=1 Tax=Leptolyngbya sp. 7M TaxID=2812896 RepID=UPI001B8CC7E0|nr:hypothetical protein [Leptolyngbya sp. 7M]QYO61949.1 hypothetical protein JVX88_17615 [Leptolyngbya sp. 7M]
MSGLAGLAHTSARVGDAASKHKKFTDPGAEFSICKIVYKSTQKPALCNPYAIKSEAIQKRQFWRTDKYALLNSIE